MDRRGPQALDGFLSTASGGDTGRAWDFAGTDGLLQGVASPREEGT